METVELTCEKRETRPKGMVHALRRAGRVPGIVYGPTTSPIAVAVGHDDLKVRVASQARTPVIKLHSPAGELNGKHVVLKEIQRAPVSGEILHADFYEVDLKRTIRVGVPFKFIGRAVGVTEGGILQPLVRKVELECLPLEIPEFIEVDVSALGIHDVIHISALKFAGNVKPIYDNDYAVVSVLPPTVAEAPTPAAAVAAEGVPAEGAPAEAGAAAPGAAAPAEGAAAKEGAAAAAAAPPSAGAKKGEPAAKKAEPAKKEPAAKK